MVGDVILAKLQSVVQVEQAGYDVDYLTFENGHDTWTLKALNENMLMEHDPGTGRKSYTTAPNGIAPVFDVGGAGNFVPLNNGDDLKQANVIGYYAIVVTLKERCALYGGRVGASFDGILRGEPFVYTGAITPTDCIP